MSEKILDIENIKLDIKGDLKELAALEKAAEAKRSAIAAVVEQKINAIQVTDEELEDEDFIDDFRDAVSDLAWSFGMTWSGAEYYDEIVPGEISFWVASTC